MLLFVTVWGAMIVPKATVRVVDRLDPTLGARRGRQRADRARAVRLAHQPGRRRAHAPHRAGVHAPRRPRLPAPRADLRGEARGQGDAARDHRRGVREERPQLCPPVRLPCAAARATSRPTICASRPTSGRWSPPRARRRPGPRRRACSSSRPAAGRRRGHDRDRARDRHLPGGRRAAQCPVGRRDRARRHGVRAADLPGRADGRAGAGRAAGGAPRPPTTS